MFDTLLEGYKLSEENKSSSSEKGRLTPVSEETGEFQTDCDEISKAPRPDEPDSVPVSVTSATVCDQMNDLRV